MTADADWEQRSAALWAEIDHLEEQEFLARIDALAGELPADSAVGMFERASAQDSTGHPDQAVPLYEAALAAGLVGERRRRAVIQLASSRRNLGDPAAALQLLEAEASRPADDLDGAVAAFRALTLADLGREREALAVALTALAGYLPRYNRSAARYAVALLEPDDDFPPGIGKPARRALIAAGYVRLDQLTGLTSKELLGMHGVGPKAVRILADTLARSGRSLRPG